MSEPPRASAQPPPDEVEPLTADLRRLHVTVSRRLLEKVAAAKDGLAHALPGATTAQVLEAALDLLLEKQARRRATPAGARACAQVASTAMQVATTEVHPSSLGGLAVPAGSASNASDGPAKASGAARAAVHPKAASPSKAKGYAEAAVTASPNAPPAANPAAARVPHPRFIPAAVRREVWMRDGQRCQYPLDRGGTCGATHRLELDHLVPLALGGQATAANLRVVCARHNRYAARIALGEAAAERGPHSQVEERRNPAG